jgi:hypothetical protein
VYVCMCMRVCVYRALHSMHVCCTTVMCDEVPVLWHMLAKHLEEHQQVEAAGPSH